MNIKAELSHVLCLAFFSNEGKRK